VVAAPPYSLTLRTWCFPVAGCVSYRGYFSEAAAQAEAAALTGQGLEVSVHGVPAYSTLGWMNWAGGDPLLNTFIQFPEGELARLLFHELAHQVVYARDDTPFNESFATAVERLGAERWLARHGSEAARAEYALLDGRRRDLRALVKATREELAALYASGATLDDATRAAQKAAAMQRFRDRHAALKLRWGGFSGYDAWVARANNASLGAMAVYDELVPAFEALFAREGSDWPRFYDAVRKLAQQPREQRHQSLKQMRKETARA
jgi:predicted aminopeptidase